MLPSLTLAALADYAMSRTESGNNRAPQALLDDALPPHLHARTTRLGAGDPRPEGAFVLCWLHHAVRSHENPVLDAAVHLANALDKPVLVYQGLGGKHRYNSDRHHTFIMEGARELASALDSRNIGSAFHLPRNPHAPGPLLSLAKRSCLVVTEDYPAPPFPRWTTRLAERSSRTVFVVDGACLLPIRSLGTRHTRAFKFRDAAGRAWRSAIAAQWRDAEPQHEPISTDRDTLGFDRVAWQHADIAELCAHCEIDHGVPPVGRAEGGSTAGYRRWLTFRDEHLRRYDRRRNDAADMDAVSGLSPYLHHGHVSPFRIAREAHEHGGKGAEKFLDELLVWRELAFNFCLHTPEHDLESLRALPAWARQTLQDHAPDQREATYTWETLARAATGTELWDLAQRSLTLNGELHNNLRMTWGKAIAAWTPSPEAALRNLIDLNHRFALDGCDPNSYGGLLWCLGQFDRPFPPERPVLGTVRERPVPQHAKRLDPSRFAAALQTRRGFASIRVAVVGGGISGLACASVLKDQGCNVTVFDRGRSAGGRLATRTPRDADAPAFDHGAPYFTARDPRFGRYVRSWIEAGICTKWDASRGRWAGGRLEPAQADAPLIVAKPSMSALCRHLAAGLDLQTATTIAAATPHANGWELTYEHEQNHPPFDALVLAMPPEQAQRLLGNHHTACTPELRSVVSNPVWIGLFGVTGLSDLLPDDLETVGDEAIERIIRNERKPGRTDDGTALLAVHARSDWSAARYDDDRDAIAAALSEHSRRVLRDVTGRVIHPDQFVYARAHRWGLAGVVRPTQHPCLFDPNARLAICGDGFGGAGVEAAFLSGRAAAGRVLSLRPQQRQATLPPATGSLFQGEST